MNGRIEQRVETRHQKAAVDGGRAMLAALGVLFLVSSTACSDTGQERVTLPLFVSGTALEEPLRTRGGEATLERAQLAFGPLYLCAGQQAGDLCDTARLEWPQSAVVDLLDPEPSRAGTLTGVSGSVRSYMFDYGITSLMTRQTPLVLPAAEQLGSVSLRLDGVVTTPSGDVPFSVAVAVSPGSDVEPGVPVVRKSASEPFEHEVSEDPSSLVVRFDPQGWLQGVDFTVFAEDAACSPLGPSIACAGTVAQSCADDGSVEATEDCALAGEICIAGEGCADRIWIEQGVAGYQSIENALVVGERPTFEFGDEP